MDDERIHLLHSLESDIIQTLAEGVPESKPIIVRTYTLNHERIALFWKKGNFANGPLKGYKLTLTSQENENSSSSMVS